MSEDTAFDRSLEEPTPLPTESGSVGAESGYRVASEYQSQGQMITPLAGGTSADTSTPGGQGSQSVVEKGKETAQTVVEKGKDVVAETGQQAQNLAHRARIELSDQADSQQKRAAEGLRSIGSELQSMVDNGGQSGMASQLGQEVAQKVNELAGWLEQRQPGAILDEARNYARRHPGVFIFGAVAAGIVVGRLTRGMVSAVREDGQGTSGESNGSSASAQLNDVQTPPLSKYESLPNPDSPIGGVR